MDVFNLIAVSTFAARLAKLEAYLLTLTSAPYVAAKLFQTNIAMTPSTLLAALTEANYSGYAPIVVSSFDGPFLDPAGVAYASTPLLPFSCNGGGVGNTIYTAGLVESTGAAATATATEVAGALATVTVTAGGSGYLLPPRVTIGDATIGAGATAHAVLTGGVVTSIVIDTPGSGYTGPTVTLERPVQLIQGFNLQNPAQMAVNTDGLLLTLEIDQSN